MLNIQFIDDKNIVWIFNKQCAKNENVHDSIRSLD